MVEDANGGVVDVVEALADPVACIILLDVPNKSIAL